MHGWHGAVESLSWRFVLVGGLVIGCMRLLLDRVRKRRPSGRIDLILGLIGICLWFGAYIVWGDANFVEVLVTLSMGYVFAGLATMFWVRQRAS